ncbi:MAG TPA: hypothetical protein VI479_15015 [Blastocatellia bacterium]
MIDFFRNRVRAIAISFAATCAFFPQARAEADDLLRYRGGLRNSLGEHKLSAKQLDAVLTSLRDKTGLLEMRFDEEGFLALGDRAKFSGGSDTARALLYAATSMSSAVELESHMYSSRVAFARITCSTVYLHYPSGVKIDVFPLEIDFSDFSKLRGARQAIAAFDLGFVILHELAHTAFSLTDAADDPLVPGASGGLGDCETMINRIRRELNLPERQTYIAQTYTAQALGSGRSSTRLAELVFARKVEKQGRMQIEKFNLNWDASAVGPVIMTEDRGSKIEDRGLKIANSGSRIVE